MPSNVSAAADYTALLEQYKQMQSTAYTSKSVTQPQLDSLKQLLDTYLSTHVTDAGQKEKLTSSFENDFKLMSNAISLKESQNQNSDESWDTVRQDMQSLLSELAPQEATDTVYDPTAPTPATTGAPQVKSLSVVTPPTTTASTPSPASMVDASGADMTGVDAYMAQHPEAAPYLDMVKKASVSYTPNTPVRVLLAQINSESGFNPNAVGPFGEQGLTQFTKETWASYGEGSYDNARDPQTAINAQAKYMASLQQENGGNLAYALESYNGWERDKSYDYNVGKRCSPTYVQDATGLPYDQRKDSTG